jgi:hypothetical protein
VTISYRSSVSSNIFHNDDPVGSKHVATVVNKLVCLTETLLFQLVPIRHIGMTSIKKKEYIVVR